MEGKTQKKIVIIPVVTIALLMMVISCAPQPQGVTPGADQFVRKSTVSSCEGQADRLMKQASAADKFDCAPCKTSAYCGETQISFCGKNQDDSSASARAAYEDKSQYLKNGCVETA